MARLAITIALICSLTLPTLNANEDLLNLASSFMQNMGDGGNSNGMGALGNIVGTLMQGDAGRNLASLFGQGKSEDTVDMLAGLGSLLGGQDGKIDPAMIGSMVSMFAQNMAPTEAPKRQKRDNKNDFDFNSMLNLASGLFANKDAAGLLPIILNSITALSSTESEKIAHEHKDHASFLPPFLEKAHLYWDLFINSDLGKTVWEKSGLKQGLKAFAGPDGKISFELMLKNLENHSFRRHWIKAAAKYLTDIVVHVAKPDVYKKYLSSGQYIINSFLDTQGFPKTTHVNMKTPEKSITVLVNYVLKKYMDIETDVSEYVKPAIDYLKQTLKLAEKTTQSMSTKADYNKVADRLTDTLNLEIIEPVLRVYRAYRHSAQAPHCQEHLMCLVNRHPDHGKPGLAGFKAGLTKLSSFIASAALSFQNGQSFWALYNAIQNDANCEAKYPADCSSFHEHELKVTTEVYHSEL